MPSSTKTVLVTGATRGIGLAFVKLYQDKGWNVIGAARNLNKAQQLEALAPYKIVQLDTSDETSILQAAKQLEGESIDLVINNAGICMAEDTKATLIGQIEVNAVGPFLVTQALLPNLRAASNRSGLAVVAQISSGMGSIGDNTYGGWIGYRASKAALNMINASLAHDLKRDNIAAITLCPGYVSTDMTSHAGSISASKSVEGLSEVIEGITLADSGTFRNYRGTTMEW